MESPRTKAKCARERRKEKEEEPAATGPGHPALARKSGVLYPESTETDLASPDIHPPARTSGPSPGHPDPAYPEGIQANTASPDIRHLAKARTSGPTPGHPAPPVCAQ